MSKLRIAIPNKGRMSENIFELLQRAGLTVSQKSSRSLCVSTEDGLYEIIFVRTKDIPKFLYNKTCDIGFTGIDVINEANVELDNILDLDFGYCKMIVAVKEESPFNSIEEIPNDAKVATSFPNVAKKYFAKYGKEINITEVSGATEIMPRLGLADVIVDITSTGSTLKQNKLKIIAEILESTATIAGRPGINAEQKDKVASFKRAIESAIAAQEKKYLMAHIPKSILKEVKAFLPGMSSPTVTTLHGSDDDVVIHVVVDKNRVYESVDKLKELGGSSILIMTVDQIIK